MVFQLLLCSILFSTSEGDIQLQGHLKPLGSYPPLQSVAILDSIPSPEYFYKWFIKPGQPVLFKSALKNPDFKNPAYELWTDDYLREKYGKEEVTFEVHKKETRNPDDYHETTLDDFLKHYKTKNIYLVLDLLGVPVMLDDVYLPPFLRCGGAQKLLTLYNMWFSSGGTKSVLHSDSMDNINCLLEGTKKLIFFDPKYQKDIEADGFDVNKAYSSVDVDKVDLDKYPRLKSIPWIKADMEKGDCLFIPQNWYHQVNSYGSRNLAVNQWFEHPLWFNMSECDKTDQSDVDLPLSRFPAAFGDEVLRVNLFEVFKDYPHLTERDLSLILTDKNKSGDIFEYLDTNKDGRVSWEEIHQINFKDFLKKFDDEFTEDFQKGMDIVQSYNQAGQTDSQHEQKTEL